MGKSIGLLELKSIPAGVRSADEMLKAADVELLVATAICPGKYMIMISGQVGAVKSSVERGRQVAGTFLICQHIINNVHASVPPALVGTIDVEHIAALGMLETMSALTAVRAADIAAKASNITLMEVRVARGLGGKGYLMFTGEVSAVKSALNSCVAQLEETGDITSSCVIPSPHKGLLEKLM
ncbi:MAG: BMC domain-containing protein [Lachnospiraceae bacterium]|jgi:microcompartment protein CcmL/EutN|nr:BMC domain-containing protein [Lachnospiraceae bacterium]